MPHGRRAIGVLLFQDVALIPLLLLVPLLTGENAGAKPTDYLRLVATSIAFVVGVVALRRILAKWVIPKFASYRSPELVVLFSLVSLGAVTFTAYNAGLPPAVGAFAAGLIFSGNRWTKQIDALVLPFRESFAVVFFVSLGLLFDPRTVMAEPLVMLGLLIALIVVKALAATIALFWTGVRWQAAAGMGIGLAHIGEFAFVLVLLGSEAGVVAPADYQRVVALAIGSLVLTPLLLKLGLRWTRSTTAAEETTPEDQHGELSGGEAIVIGAGPIGRQVSSRLETMGKDVCLVDLSPVNLHQFRQQGFRTVAGDATDPRVLNLAGASRAAIVIVCVPEDTVALRIVKSVRAANESCPILVRCRYQNNVDALMKRGATRVVSEEAQASGALLRMLGDLVR